MITVTDSAAKKISQYLKETPEATAFRVIIKPGGCAGFTLKFGLDNPTVEDLSFESNGVKVIFNSKMLEYLNGSTIDHFESINGSGFNLISPQSKGCCGCSKSQCF